MKHFKVKYGHGVNDYHSIPESELASAISAQINGRVVMFKTGTISGNSIIAIIPDFNRLMGYNPGYELTGEDMMEIGRDRREGYEKFIEDTRNKLTNTQKQLNG